MLNLGLDSRSVSSFSVQVNVTVNSIKQMSHAFLFQQLKQKMDRKGYTKQKYTHVQHL